MQDTASLVLIRERKAVRSGGWRQGSKFVLNRGNELLDGINFLLLKIGLAALATHPRRNFIEGDMTPPAIGMKGGVAPSHVALAMNTLHRLTLTVKSSDHSLESGR